MTSFFRIVKILLVASLIIGAAWGWQQLKDPEQFPINTVKVQATYAHAHQAILAEILTPYANQGFFGLDKKGLAKAIMDTSPWIAEVKLNRIWPDGLNVEIVEQVPVAQWEDKALINAEGEIFTPALNTFPKNLPILSAEEAQIPELFLTYEKIRVILNPIHATVMHLSLSDREALTLTLDNGTRIIIGPKDPLPRLQRFVKVHPKVFKSERHAERIDLRYEHGLSVKWRGD